MRQTYLESTEDLQWLSDVHGVNVKSAACAILYGNEDSPERVEVYTVNDYRCAPTVYVQGDDGNLILQ